MCIIRILLFEFSFFLTICPSTRISLDLDENNNRATQIEIKGESTKNLKFNENIWLNKNNKNVSYSTGSKKKETPNNSKK